MKKLFTLFTAIFVAVTMNAFVLDDGRKGNSDVPQVEAPADGYVTIVLNIPSGSECNGIYLKGTLNSSWTNCSGENTYVGLDAANLPADQAIRFESINGSLKWYKATFKLGQTDNLGLAGKVCLKYTDDASWQGQAKDVTVNLQYTTIAYSISNDGQFSIADTETGLLYLNIGSWQRSECGSPITRTITVIVPDCSTDIPSIVGSFNDWNPTELPMTLVEGNTYTSTVKAFDADEFKIASSVDGWDNQIQIYDESSSAWYNLANMSFGSRTVINLDFSDAAQFKWTSCPDEPVLATYTVTVKVPDCCTAIPTIVGSFNDWNPTELPMTQVDDFTYTYSVEALNTDEFKFASSTNGWSNQIKKYDESTDTWEDLQNIPFGLQTEINLDYSDGDQYKWSFCEDIDQTKTYDFEKDGCYFNILSLSDQTVQLTCRGDENNVNNNTIATYSGDFRVPETVEFSSRTFTVTNIHEVAFQNCNFGTLTIPATVLKMGGDWAFGTCENLIIEDSETPLASPRSRSLIIGQVYDSVYLGRNISDELTRLVSEDAYHSVGEALGGEYSSITFGDNVTELGACCIGCQNLTSATLPLSVKKLSGTFSGCKNLKTVTGDGVEVINEAFTGSGIESINMPNLRIIYEAFQSCKALKTFNIPEGVIYLTGSEYGGVFYNATSLESVYIPNTVVTLDEKCFSGCTALKTISVANPIPIEIEENNFDISTYFSATLKVPVGSKEAYMNAPVWSNFLNIVEDDSLVPTLATVGILTHHYDIVQDENDPTITYTFSPEGAFWFVYDNLIYDQFIDYHIVPIGCTMTISVQPEEGKVLSSLIVNDVDVTDQVVNNEYNITITGNATYDVYATYNSCGTGTEGTSASSAIRKQLINGQLLILRDGKTYTVQGQEVR